MKKLYLLFSLFLFLSGNLYSDDHTSSYGMEGYQCNFEKGKDMDDLIKFTSKELNPYADSNWKAPYSGFILTPYLRAGDEATFDFGWVGFTNSHKEMGIVQDSWFSDSASKTSAKWDALSDCGSQGYYMAVEAREPTVQFVEGGSTFWEIRSCSFLDGKSVEDLAASDRAWNVYNDKRGFTGGVWRWWPGPGTSNSSESDFLLNISYNSWEEYGESLDDEFWNRSSRPESILSCDKPRVYIALNARNRPFETE